MLDLIVARRLRRPLSTPSLVPPVVEREPHIDQRDPSPGLIVLIHALADVLQPRIGFGGMADPLKRLLRRHAIYVWRRLADRGINAFARKQASAKVFLLLRPHVPAETAQELADVLVTVAIDAFDGVVVGDGQPLRNEVAL